MSKQNQEVIFTEVYPLNLDYLPPLHGWEIDAPSEEATALGRKLAHRLRIHNKGHWLWAPDHLVTDARRSQDELAELLKQLWKTDDEVFKRVSRITPLPDFIPNAKTLADFVAQSIQDDSDETVRAILRDDDRKLTNAVVERQYEIQGWVVGDKPAISITINSQMIPTISLRDFVRANTKVMKDIVGLTVRDKTSTLRGRITEIRGTLGEQREDLIHRASRQQMKKVIEQAPEDDLVLRVKGKYDYPATALQLVASSGQYGVLEIDGTQALKSLQIPPKPRSQVVTKIARKCANLGYIEPKAYNSASNPDHFHTFSVDTLGLRALLGDGTTCSCNPQDVLNALTAHPPYRRSPLLAEDMPIRIAVLNFLNETVAQNGKRYIRAIAEALEKINFRVQFTGTAERPSLNSPREVEQSLDRLAAQQPHIVITAIPNDDDDNEEQSPYFSLKGAMLKRDLQSQMIYAKTLGNEYAIPNLVLGILAKTGNIPYVSDHALPYPIFWLGSTLGES